MDYVDGVTIGAVLCCWGALFVTLRHSGPGLRKRRVLCPEKKRRASVVVENTESGFGVIQATDIKACSFFPNSKVDCDKECLSRL